MIKKKVALIRKCGLQMLANMHKLMHFFSLIFAEICLIEYAFDFTVLIVYDIYPLTNNEWKTLVFHFIFN